MKNKQLDKHVQPNGSKEIVKAPYAKPALRIFGSVKSLTKGQGGSVADGYSPGSRPRK